MFFFFNETAPTEIYTLSLHVALPISPPPRPTRGSTRSATGGHRVAPQRRGEHLRARTGGQRGAVAAAAHVQDRKSTRLNSSHANISYAVFCLKKKKTYGLISNLTQDF